MSESDSEDAGPISASIEAGGTRYPIEGKFVSQRDKAEIMAMPEAKREQILSERAEEIERENFSRQLMQRREAEQKAADIADKRKRKLGNNELDDSPRKVSKTKSEANERLANYKKRREEMNEARRGRPLHREKQDPSQLFDDENSDAEGDVEYAYDRSSPPRRGMSPRRREPSPGLRDYELTRIGRTGFSSVCFTPGFETTVPGCFARVNIGPSERTRQNVYRMTEIRSITTGKAYTIEDKNGRPFMTDQYVRTGSGKGEKTFPFIACSDGAFTEEEFQRYKADMAKDNMKTPSRDKLMIGNHGIHALIHHRWTSEEITAKIERSGKRKEQFHRLERARLGSERKQALAIGDHERVAKIDAELEDMGAIKQPLISSSPNKQPGANGLGKSQSQPDRVARMNEANRKAEIEHRRKVQLAEKRREREMAKKGLVDPFARVKTTTTIHHDSSAYDSGRSITGTPEPTSKANGATANGGKPGNGSTLQVPGADKAFDGLFDEASDRSRAGTPAKSSINGSKAGTPTPQKPKTVVKLGGSKKKVTDDDLIAGLLDDDDF